MEEGQRTRSRTDGSSEGGPFTPLTPGGGDGAVSTRTSRRGRMTQRQMSSMTDAFAADGGPVIPGVAASSNAAQLYFSGTLRPRYELTHAEWKRMKGSQMTMLPIRRLRTARSLGHRTAPARSNESQEANFYEGRSIFGLPILDQACAWATAWAQWVLLLDSTYTAFIMPILIAWSSRIIRTPFLNGMEIVVALSYLMQVLFSFHVGVVAHYNYQMKMITDGRAIAQLYLWKGPFLVDMLAALPVVPLVILSVVNPVSPRTFAWEVEILNMLRMFRVVRILNLIRALFRASMTGKSFGRLSSVGMYFVSLSYSLAVLINFMGCCWFYLASKEGFEGTWISSVGGDDLTDARGSRQYLASIYFTITTLTTVGYGDTGAKTALEECLAMMAMVLGILTFGFITSSITEIISVSSQEARKGLALREKIASAESWMEGVLLPRRLQDVIKMWYSEVWVNQQDKDTAEFISELPPSIRSEIALHVTREVMCEEPVFASMPESILRQLASKMTFHMVPPGHEVCQEGDQAECLWFLVEGSLLAICSCIKTTYVVEAPSMVGEAALAARVLPMAGVRPLTARAQDICHIWQLNLNDLFAVLETRPDLHIHLLESCRQRLLLHGSVNTSLSENEKEGALADGGLTPAGGAANPWKVTKALVEMLVPFDRKIRSLKEDLQKRRPRQVHCSLVAGVMPDERELLPAVVLSAPRQRRGQQEEQQAGEGADGAAAAAAQGSCELSSSSSLEGAISQVLATERRRHSSMEEAAAAAAAAVASDEAAEHRVPLLPRGQTAAPARRMDTSRLVDPLGFHRGDGGTAADNCDNNDLAL